MSQIIEVNKFHEFAFYAMKLIGINIIENGENCEFTFGIHYILFAMSNFLYGCCEVIRIVDRLMPFEDNHLFPVVFASLTSSFRFVATFKSILILSKKDKVIEALARFKKIFPHTIEDQRLFQVEKNYAFTRKILIAYSFVPFSLGIFAYFTCIVVAIVNLNSEGKSPLFFDAWYPVDSSDPKFFLFCFAHQVVSNLFSLASFFGIDYLLISFIMLSKMNFNRLGENFESTPEDICETIRYHIYITKFVFKIHNQISYFKEAYR